MAEYIRWVQRLNNFEKALITLSDDIKLAEKRELSNIEKRGLIQAFEYSYELSWKVIKDFYQNQGEEIQGSKDAFRLAFNRGLVEQGITLMETIKSRQLTVHTYNEGTADEIYLDIVNKYYDSFAELLNSLKKEKSKRGL